MVTEKAKVARTNSINHSGEQVDCRDQQFEKDENTLLRSRSNFLCPDLFLKAEDGFSVQKVKPLFCSKSKYIFIGSGCNIQIFSATSGSLIQTLRGHSNEVVNICRKNDGAKESIVSCDVSGQLIYWSQGSRKDMVVGITPKLIVSYFELMPKNGYLVGFRVNEFQNISYHSGFGASKSYKLFTDILVGPNAVSVNRDRTLIAALKKRTLVYAYSPFTNPGFHRSKDELTCVQCHPFEDTVAYGDALGRITLLYEVHKKWPSTQILHWHTLPVADFCFTSSGSRLISGGGESVCIQWDLRNGAQHKLPRLGMPIVGVTLDEENDYVIVTHSDNGISLLNPHSFSLSGVIARLTKHVPQVEGEYKLILPAGIHINPLSKHLVLNGRVGHLQFFDLYKNRLICHFDITQTNFLTDERHAKMANPDVTHVDISSDGRWMVTCESCILTPSFTDIKLKFWLFDDENQRWKLNTRVIQPHDGDITSVQFSPSLPDTPLRCITCGIDGKFNVWMLYKSDKVESKDSNEHWYCFLSERYLDFIPSCCTFSPDGSLLVVAFGRILTFWETSRFKLFGTLSQSFLKHDIRFVEFNQGSHAGCFLISCSSYWICCWDILASKLLWRIRHTASSIASNPISGMMAIFTEDKEVYLFHPSRCKPVAALNDFSKNIMIASRFVPSLDRSKSATENLWLSNHKLVCIDSEQILYTVEGESADITDDTADRLTELSLETQWKGATPFASLASKSHEKMNEKLKNDIRNAEMSYTSPDALIKAFSDVQVFNLPSFSSVLTEFSGVVPPAPIAAGAVYTPAPTYVTLDEDGEVSRVENEQQIKVSNLVVKSVNYEYLVSKIKWTS